MRASAATLGTQLGQRIRELRGALSFTQEELAERAAISVSFLSMIERGALASPQNIGGARQRLGRHAFPALPRCERTTGERRAGARPSPHRIPWNFAS